MMVRFFDSNVLVYYVDNRDDAKQKTAEALDVRMVKRGFEIKRQYDIQFYDAMMVAAAERAGADELCTEDLNDGQFYCGVKAVNPFK